ncbi:MAG: hypothetical protein PHR81_04220 [Bacteroidales bacterium]|jgi:predicted anti-sigma-YlaC factor YlaD|nr:hypothetical protein [Bacteroidales bacterium]MDD4213998.1 hypothetical protein [Bacteroidales bacterium]
MDCKNFGKNILNYFYQDTDTALHQEMQEHLAQCSTCKVIYQKLTSVLSTVPSDEELMPDEFFQQRLIAKINNLKSEVSAGRILSGVLRPVFSAILILAGIFIGIKISDHLFDNNDIVEQNQNIKNAEVLIAEEYGLKENNMEALETYYLSNNE